MLMIKPLRGHQFEVQNICAECGGELRSSDGSYCTRMALRGIGAEPICAKCVANPGGQKLEPEIYQIGDSGFTAEGLAEVVRDLGRETFSISGLWTALAGNNADGHVIQHIIQNSSIFEQISANRWRLRETA